MLRRPLWVRLDVRHESSARPDKVRPEARPDGRKVAAEYQIRRYLYVDHTKTASTHNSRPSTQTSPAPTPLGRPRREARPQHRYPDRMQDLERGREEVDRVHGKGQVRYEGLQHVVSHG